MVQSKPVMAQCTISLVILPVKNSGGAVTVLQALKMAWHRYDLMKSTT
jgi:hypothetical protein